MKCRFTITADDTDGSYELSVANVDEPGTGVDYYFMKKTLQKVLEDMGVRLEKTSSDTDGVTRLGVDDETSH